jgi:hypothetical protein
VHWYNDGVLSISPCLHIHILQKQLISLVKASGLHDDACHTVRVNVGSRATVLQVTVPLSSHVPRDTDGSTTVSDTGTEVTNVTSLVTTCETELVVFTVHGDVLVVTLRELLDGLVNVLPSSWLAHRECAVVGVATSTVPITLKRLRVVGNLDTPLLGDANQEETCHPKMVTHGDAFTRTDLELPLTGHNLGIDTADVHARVETSTVVGLDEITSKDLSGACTTVIGTLGSREPTLWPADRSGTIGFEEGVLLLETEPRFDVLCEIHYLGSVVAVVCPVGSTVVVVCLCKDKDVVTTTEGVLEDRRRTEVDVGVVARSLVGGGAIKVPDAELTDVGNLFGDGSGLGAETAITVDPDILCLDLFALGKGEVGGEEVDALGGDELGHGGWMCFWGIELYEVRSTSTENDC